VIFNPCIDIRRRVSYNELDMRRPMSQQYSEVPIANEDERINKYA
jgi:hypothetical protein